MSIFGKKQETKFDVISIGSATRDIFLEPGNTELRDHPDSPTGQEQCFPLGIKMEIKDIVVTTGGGGTNTAVTFARQGFKTACVGVVGDDAIGEDIIKELEDEHVATFFEKHEAKSAYSTVLVHTNGERTIFSYKGEGQKFELGEMKFDKLLCNWIYLASLGGNTALISSILDHAEKNKIKVAMNPGGKDLELGLENLQHILSRIHIIVTNKEEAVALLGMNSSDTMETIVEKLKSVIPNGIAVLTDGKNGVFVKDTAGKMYSASVPDSPVVERTGAGDAFGSGFVSEYMRSGSIEKAIQFGTANASSVVTQFGAKAGILRQGEWGSWTVVDVKTS